ncbi:MAG: GNAT family N-acetyltransferase [Ruminococcus sp.]|nr:GNAT family N-acetyltransferase [Ruminococcus sp.]
MKINYQKASFNNISEIMDIIRYAVRNMEQERIYQWDELYPAEKDIINDINNGELYVGRVNEKIAVIYVINSYCDEEYNNGEWQNPNANYQIVHRLCVHPDFQNNGIAKATMQHIETELCQSDVEAIRLDAFTENPYALKLYQNLGYSIVGYADWRKGRFYLMEKYIKGN